MASGILLPKPEPPPITWLTFFEYRHECDLVGKAPYEPAYIG